MCETFLRSGLHISVYHLNFLYYPTSSFKSHTFRFDQRHMSYNLPITQTPKCKRI